LSRVGQASGVRRWRVAPYDGAVRRRTSAVDPLIAARELAGLFEAARPTRLRAGHVRVDLQEVERLVKDINTATGSASHRDWRGRVTVTPNSPLAAVANEARTVVERARPIPFADDVLLRGDHGAQLATALRAATA
jgi:hypothetical protein